MDNSKLSECSNNPGYYEISGYANYAISVTGMVLNKKKNKKITGSRNPAGYVNFRLTDDDGYCLTWGRHHLLCFVFKHPNKDITMLVVNHINGIKGDDRLVNLEWATEKENVEHAGFHGLTDKCTPISVRDIDSGIVDNYPSIIEYARISGMTKDSVSYRVKSFGQRVFPERKQYKPTASLASWLEPASIMAALEANGTTKAVLVKNVFTDEVIRYEKLTDLAAEYSLSPGTVSQWSQRKDQPVLPGFIQLKLASDPSDWRLITDPYLELGKFTGRRIVRTVNDITGDARIYLSANDCADDNGLSSTALNYRLKSNGAKIFADGYRYGYYPY